MINIKEKFEQLSVSKKIIVILLSVGAFFLVIELPGTITNMSKMQSGQDATRDVQEVSSGIEYQRYEKIIDIISYLGSTKEYISQIDAESKDVKLYFEYDSENVVTYVQATLLNENCEVNNTIFNNQEKYFQLTGLKFKESGGITNKLAVSRGLLRYDNYPGSPLSIACSRIDNKVLVTVIKL